MSQFEEAYEKYNRDMYHRVRRLGLTHAWAEDCVQEAAQRLGQMQTISYVNEYKVKGLFCKVAENVARDSMRRVKVSDRRKDKFHQDTSIKDSLNVRRSRKDRDLEISIVVHQALAKLSEVESWIAWKYYAMQMSLREIREDLLKEKGLTWSHLRIRNFIRSVVKPKLKGALVELGGEKL